jgi:methionyl-tRNA synthetase
MTRDIDWGIPVPLDGWRDHPTKRFYVWFDAVIGYLSASIEWARRSGDSDAWRHWWNNPDALSYYFMGKDNITFHSQIWPAELLAYDGRGSRGGQPGVYGELELPTEVVSSEFLTMESRKFSSSRGVVIYVRDLLERYQADALRYFICAAGPENSDSDFTWAEFLRRTNGELVAGWGNLVNRTATMLHRSFGEIPKPVELEATDSELLAEVEEAFDSVGELIRTHRQRQAIAEAMRIVGEVNKYVTEQAPYKLKDESQRERLATILYVVAQAVSDCNLLLSPFLPFSANTVHAALGGTGTVAAMPRIDEVDDLDGGPSYPVITGDYSDPVSWQRHPVTPGAPVGKPSPIFVKLDPSIVDEELARLGLDEQR